MADRLHHRISRKQRLLRLFLFCALLAAAVRVSSQQSDSVVVTDDSTLWRVGIARFRSGDISTENAYLRSSIPLLIFDEIEQIEHHHVTATERDARARRLIARKIAEVEKSLASHYRSYDKARLSPGPGSSNMLERIKVEEKRLGNLEKLSIDAVEIPERKRVSMVEGNEERLLEPIIEHARHRADRLKLDWLVWGEIEQLDEYLFVRVTVYDANIDSTATYSTAGSREAIRDNIAPKLKEIRTAAIGREWGTLAIEVEPDAGRVELNDTYVGTGDQLIDPVFAGKHVIHIKAPGYSPHTEVIEIAGGEQKQVTIELAQRTGRDIRIESDPPGATAYLGSIKQGATPIEIKSPLEPTQLRLELDGYNTHQASVVPDLGGDITADLLPAIIDEPAVIKNRRMNLYRSIGAFALSVPIPMITLDWTNTLTEAYIRSIQSGSGGTTSQEGRRLYRGRMAAFSGYTAGLFVSGALFVNLVLDLLEYTDVVGLSTGYAR